MNDRENDNRIKDEGRQVQQELEDQLRAFGDTMTDAFAHGFEGRGMEIGDRAWDVGKAAVHAANFGISEAGKALRNSRNEYYKAQQEAQKTGPRNAGGMPQWARQIFGLKGEQTPVDLLRADGKKRQNGGAALLAVGITFMVIFGLGTLGCLIGLGIISPAALGDVVVSATEGGGILMTGTDYVMNTAYNVLGIVSGVLGLATAGFGWMTACGSAWVKAGKQLGQFADLADTTDYHQGLSVRMLADLVHQNRKKMLKKLQKYISDVKVETATRRAILVNEGEGYGLLLDPAAVTATQIKTPQGSLTLNVKTKEVSWDLAGQRDGSVVLEYMLLVGMQPVSALRVSLFLKK